MEPHFLPYENPLRAKLDVIFSTRVTHSVETLKKAGFLKPKPMQYSKTVVTKHPKLKGYVVKLYLDNCPINDAVELRSRIIGAHVARRAIARHQFEDYFEVPKKWIYPLPESPEPHSSKQRKNFILIAEEMPIMSIEVIITGGKRL